MFAVNLSQLNVSDSGSSPVWNSFESNIIILPGWNLNSWPSTKKDPFQAVFQTGVRKNKTDCKLELLASLWSQWFLEPL